MLFYKSYFMFYLNFATHCRPKKKVPR